MFKNVKFLVIIFIISILALTGCDVNSSTSNNSNSANITPLSDTEFAQLYSNTMSEIFIL